MVIWRVWEAHERGSVEAYRVPRNSAETATVEVIVHRALTALVLVTEIFSVARFEANSALWHVR